MAHDVFISYSSKDKAIADAVCARLEGRGIRCWIAPRDVQPGAPYGEEIIDAIQSSRAMVLVLSSNANASPHIPKEIERAVSRGLPIIPLRVEAVMPAKSLDYFISSVHWLDAITPPLEQHLDSLANTLRTLLPEHGTAPPATVASTTTAVPAAAKAKWLLPALGGAAILLIAAVWFTWGRSAPETSAGGTGVVTNPSDNLNPGPAGLNNLHTSRPSAPASGDPLPGCWQWYNNVTVNIRPDGTLMAGPFTAHWRLSDAAHRVYRLTWPEAVDSVTVSADGNSMSGANQYGFRMSATRVSPGPAIAGFWRWYNGATVAITPDGRFTVGNINGHWQITSPNAYALTWPDPVDTVTLSSDHSRLSGANQYGVRVSGTKLASCGGS